MVDTMFKKSIIGVMLMLMSFAAYAGDKFVVYVTKDGSEIMKEFCNILSMKNFTFSVEHLSINDNDITIDCKGRTVHVSPKHFVGYYYIRY